MYRVRHLHARMSPGSCPTLVKGNTMPEHTITVEVFDVPSQSACFSGG